MSRAEDIKAQIAALQAELEAIETPRYGAGFNLWALHKQEIGFCPPQLEYPEDFDQGWNFDGEACFSEHVFNVRENFASSKDRVKRFAAHYFPDFHYRYVTLHPGFVPSDEYWQWVLDNWNQAQRDRIMAGGFMRKGFDDKPVYEVFKHEPGIFNWAKRRVPDKDTRIDGVRIIWAGNKQRGESDVGAVDRARRTFEKHWSTGFGGRRAIGVAAAAVRELDILYADTPKAEREQFLSDRPFYEPK